jgi:hypothetical protein
MCIRMNVHSIILNGFSGEKSPLRPFEKRELANFNF